MNANLWARELLEHLYVLLPVLDDDKHYWAGADEVDELLRRGSDWLASHPHRELIASRYLRHDRALTSEALARISDDLDDADPDADPDADSDAGEAAVEAPISLNKQRLAAVTGVVVSSGARRVVDLGCGEGRLLQALLRDTAVDHVLGVDASPRAIELAARRLHLDTMAPRQRQRVELIQGSLTYGIGASKALTWRHSSK